MSRRGFHVHYFFLTIAVVTLLNVSHISAQAPRSMDTDANNSVNPVATFKTSARMVTLEVVVKDRAGHHVPGLKAADFEVFEQAPSRGKQKHEQKISAFHEVHVADVAAAAKTEIKIPEGSYANLVTFQKNPVPPTILLVDGINTDLKDQAQVHVQMLHMLKSLPPDVPIAVFLLGYRLRLLQDLTSDPKLLQAALDKAITADGVGIARVDPRDDPNEVSAQMEKVGTSGSGALPEAIEATKDFEQSVYAANMDRRVNATIDALTTLSRHVSGYPGRKNLLWISTSFPMYLQPRVLGENEKGYRNYWARLRRLGNVLSESKVAVYPINPAGVQTPAFYEAETRPRAKTADTLSRESLLLGNEQDTMEVLADGTGGKVCTGNNSLGDCVRRAVDDSSEFYEIAYYPDSQNWNGEYRSIILKPKQSGLRLAYRGGYFANAEGVATAKEQRAQLQSACQDYLDATAITILAKREAGDSPDRLTFNVTLNLSALTLTPTTDGGRDVNVALAICTFDDKGRPLQLLEYPVTRTLSREKYQSVAAVGNLSENVYIPGLKPATVRLLVKDLPSGRLGSLRIPIKAGAIGPSAAASTKGSQDSANLWILPFAN